MQSALRSDQAKAAREEMDRKKRGKGKKCKPSVAKAKSFRRKGNKLHWLRRRASRLSTVAASSSGDGLDADLDGEPYESEHDEPEVEAEPSNDGPEKMGDEKKKKNAGRKPGPKAKAKAKAGAKPKSKAKAKARPKASAKASAKAKAKAKAAKGKPGPKAKAKASPKGKASADKPLAGRKVGKKAKAADGDADGTAFGDHPKQRRVWIGRRWLFEILPDQVRGCSSCRYIYNGCTACVRANFKGKTATEMREDDEYWWAASWLDENGMDGLKKGGDGSDD